MRSELRIRVEGPPAAGKTSLLTDIREALIQKGHRAEFDGMDFNTLRVRPADGVVPAPGAFRAAIFSRYRSV